jgi:hypothetical protein
LVIPSGKAGIAELWWLTDIGGPMPQDSKDVMNPMTMSIATTMRSFQCSEAAGTLVFAAGKFAIVETAIEICAMLQKVLVDLGLKAPKKCWVGHSYNVSRL